MTHLFEKIRAIRIPPLILWCILILLVVPEYVGRLDARQDALIASTLAADQELGAAGFNQNVAQTYCDSRDNQK